jgi:hypothetical protein
VYVVLQWVVVDGEGNAASFIQSNYMGFGLGIVPTVRGWGVGGTLCGLGFHAVQVTVVITRSLDV